MSAMPEETWNLRGEMPPQFAPWMRSLDPALEQEDHNPAFIAFRVRREEHNRSWRHRARDFALQLVAGIGSKLLLLLVLGLAIQLLGWIGLVVTAVGAIAIRA